MNICAWDENCGKFLFQDIVQVSPFLFWLVTILWWSIFRSKLLLLLPSLAPSCRFLVHTTLLILYVRLQLYHTLQIGPQIVKCLNFLLYTDLGLISGFSFLFFLLHSLCAGTAKRRIEVHYYQQLNKPVSFFLLLRTGFDDLEWLFF